MALMPVIFPFRYCEKGRAGYVNFIEHIRHYVLEGLLPNKIPGPISSKLRVWS